MAPFVRPRPDGRIAARSGPREAAVSEFGVTLLILAVVLALAWLVLQRVGALGRGVRELARAEDLRALARSAEAAGSHERLQPIEESLRRLSDAVSKLPAPLEPKDLVPVQERLELLARAVDELRHHVDELRSRGPDAVAAVGAGAQVLRTLQQRGFESVRIVGEIADEEPGDSARVPVEARRGGMSFKGFVTLEGGRVESVALKPVTEVFP